MITSPVNSQDKIMNNILSEMMELDVNQLENFFNEKKLFSEVQNLTNEPINLKEHVKVPILKKIQP